MEKKGSRLRWAGPGRDKGREGEREGDFKTVTKGGRDGGRGKEGRPWEEVMDAWIDGLGREERIRLGGREGGRARRGQEGREKRKNKGSVARSECQEEGGME